jgi:phenylpropionate dioxygenase-like ring-hydroxylating dioxygenase large terminal subunit
MAVERPLLKPFEAYLSPRDYKEDDGMTRVGRGTPGGEYLRRFWQPVAFVQELTDLPMRVRILGEDLVLFKNKRGDVGLLELHCSHRGASLEYGVIEERGIRCFYHGWLYGTDGTVLQTPAGPPLCNAGKFCHGAYPLHVYHDLIFAYMGPPDKKPPFPIFDVYEDPNITVEPAVERTGVMDCNWLQIQENGNDPAHTAFLHVLVSGTQRGFSDEMGVLPDMQFESNDVGTHYIASRRVGDNVWVRIIDTVLPNIAFVPPDDQRANKGGVAQWAFTAVWAVPIDDYNTKRLYLLFNDKRQPLKQYQRVRAFGQANDRTYAERQRHPGDYDAMMSQGPINIHAYENLATSDIGLNMFRDFVRAGIKDVQAGRDPRGVVRDMSRPIRTRTQNTVIHAPAATTAAADAELRRKIGRDVAEGDYRRQMPPC